MRDGWREVAIGEICTLTRGVTPTLKAIPGPYPLVVTAATPLSSDSYQFEGEAVCVPLVSSTGHGHASLKRVHYARGKFAVANIITTLEARVGVDLDIKFLWMLLDHGRDSIIVPLMKGTANVSLSQRALAGAQITLPPLEEQRRIVNLIEAVDDAIKSAESARSTLGVATRRMPDAVIAKSKSLGIVSSPLHEILGGKSSIRTGPFGSQLHKKNYIEGGPVAVVMPANMKAGRVDLESAARISERDAKRLSRHLAKTGDILWARRGDVTRFAVIDEKSAGSLCGTGCFMLRPESPSDTGWLEVVLSSQSVAEWLISHAVGVTMPNLNTSVLGEVPIVVPEASARETLRSSWRFLRLTDGEYMAHQRRLRTLRSNVLTALLSGEHEIPESYDELLAEESV